MPCRVLTLLVLGVSLAPAIADHSLLKALPLDCTTPIAARDLVFFHSGARNIPLIKRVLAVPGDRFTVADDGTLRVNDAPARNSANQPYQFPPWRAAMLKLYERDYNGHIPSQAYLVLGEKSSGTVDSSVYGLIDQKDILGKVTEIISPGP